MIKIIIFSLLVLAAQTTTLKFKIGQETIKFYENKKLRVITSKDCAELKNDKLCPNLIFLETINTDGKKYSRENRPNFGSRACEDTLKGKVYLGFDKERNEITFCKINDDFFLDLGTISYYVEKNKGLVAPSNRRTRK